MSLSEKIKNNVIDLLYENYSKKTKWHSDATAIDKSEEFVLETKRAGLEKKASILDIGFGEGEFLEWAHSHGYIVQGVEINESFINHAKRKGLVVHLSDPRKFLQRSNTKWDAIWIFDVLEHLDLDEIFRLFCNIAPKLNTNGKVLIRIPNGVSPFGRFHQYGDATHITSLSAPIIGDIAKITGLEIEIAANSARPTKSSKYPFFLKIFQFILRDLVEMLIGLIYFGGKVPLDSNITIILRKNTII